MAVAVEGDLEPCFPMVRGAFHPQGGHNCGDSVVELRLGLEGVHAHALVHAEIAVRVPARLHDAFNRLVVVGPWRRERADHLPLIRTGKLLACSSRDCEARDRPLRPPVSRPASANGEQQAPLVLNQNQSAGARCN